MLNICLKKIALEESKLGQSVPQASSSHKAVKLSMSPKAGNLSTKKETLSSRILRPTQDKAGKASEDEELSDISSVIRAYEEKRLAESSKSSSDVEGTSRFRRISSRSKIVEGRSTSSSNIRAGNSPGSSNCSRSNIVEGTNSSKSKLAEGTSLRGNSSGSKEISGSLTIYK